MKLSTKQKLDLLVEALIKKYGEGSVVTRTDVMSVWETDKKTFPCHIQITKNDAYKVARNTFVIAKDQNLEKYRKAYFDREAQKLPKEIRTSVEKLVELITEDDEKETKALKTVKKEYKSYIPTFDEIDDAFGGNDIEDVLALL